MYTAFFVPKPWFVDSPCYACKTIVFLCRLRFKHHCLPATRSRFVPNIDPYCPLHPLKLKFELHLAEMSRTPQIMNVLRRIGWALRCVNFRSRKNTSDRFRIQRNPYGDESMVRNLSPNYLSVFSLVPAGFTDTFRPAIRSLCSYRTNRHISPTKHLDFYNSSMYGL